ncbi:MAG TPA: glycosyltransferase family 2 protein [Usitatibacter sp.]|nr:glycosyltransferase family 2 protein [Usitatibacter sp.]
MAAPALSATVVTYRSPPRELGRALASLAAALSRAREAGMVGSAAVYVVDNGPAESLEGLREALRAWPPEAGTIELVAGHGNVGYGRANNLVLPRLASDFHLVMNPDVEIDREALARGLEVLRRDARVGLVAPDAYGDDGARQFLCKRYPSLWVLFLRGFAPGVLRRRFARRLADYEMRDVVAAQAVADVPLASGCFMLMRTALFRRVGGFDPAYFLYFEDYDLSLRLRREAGIAFVPGARIVHHGGEAARKGPRHVAWFVRSAWRFFSTHGWKIA